MSEDRRGRSVPALYGVVSLVLVAGALTFALSSPPPSTPPLAEVAPAPQENVEVERVEQSSQFGEGADGAGDCVPGDPGCEGTGDAPTPVASGQPTPTASPSLTSATESWPCRNGGLTQTDDPQSPPCIGARFEGDNGGATARGVTATEIRIAWPTRLDENGNPTAHGRDVEDAIVAHVNKRYELYDRRIVLELVDTSAFDLDTASGARALAREVASRDVFASLGVNGATGAFHRTLAEEGVVSVMTPIDSPVTEAYLTDLHPYVWSITPSLGESLRTGARLICDALAERTAQHAGPELSDTTRRFGVLVETDDGERIDPAELLNGLEACGAPHQVAEHDRDAENASATLEISIRRMADDGVTTVVCVCEALLPGAQEAAQAVGYEPEWFIPGLDDDQMGRAHRDQRAHEFGLTPRFRRPGTTSTGGRTFEGDYWFHAMKDGDPDAETSSELRPFYQQLLVLASGVQWAGPELTPGAFGDALVGLEFANPGVGQPRWYQPAVSMAPADHAWNSDFALLWWNNSPEEEERISATRKGGACYVGDGERFTIDTLPPAVDDLLFDPEGGCR